MRSKNIRFTYLLTYLLTPSPKTSSSFFHSNIVYLKNTEHGRNELPALVCRWRWRACGDRAADAAADDAAGAGAGAGVGGVVVVVVLKARRRCRQVEVRRSCQEVCARRQVAAESSYDTADT